jgi:hypothetical protein
LVRRRCRSHIRASNNRWAARRAARRRRSRRGRDR